MQAASMLTPLQTRAIFALASHWRAEPKHLVITHVRQGAVRVENETSPNIEGHRSVLVRASGKVKPISGCSRWGGQ